MGEKPADNNLFLDLHVPPRKRSPDLFCNWLGQQPTGNNLRLNLGGTLKDVEDAGVAEDAADLVFQREAVAAVDL